MTRPTFAGSNASLVKTHNLRAVLMNFLHCGEVSRSQLAEHTGLSSTTITNIIDGLLEQGIVVEEGLETRQGQRGVGRPRTRLRLVPAARCAVGVHIGIGVLRVALTELNSEIVAGKIAQFDLADSPDSVLEQIAQLVEAVLVAGGIESARVLGVGVGASGLVDYRTGVNVLAPTLGWREIPVGARLARRLHLPVCVDNNVRAMALGEALFGPERSISSLAFVYGRVGVGAGFVVNGEIFRGSGAGAGEIGHTIVLPDGGERCRCGRHGCLETLVSEPVILREAERIAHAAPDGLLACHLAAPGDAKPIDRVFAAARAGDAPIRLLLEARARYLGIALANLVNVLNPELIVLGGMFCDGYDLIAPVAEATMRELAFAGLGDQVQLRPTQFRWRAGVIGAAALALYTFFYQQKEPQREVA
jgi:predicted NBD/HSP70 family sugar kinase/biotin operon repressor